MRGTARETNPEVMFRRGSKIGSCTDRGEIWRICRGEYAFSNSSNYIQLFSYFHIVEHAFLVIITNYVMHNIV